METHTLVLLRHGESTWNFDNRFAGWADIGLTAKGIEQAKATGLRLRDAGFAPDLCWTSVLQRATHTLWHCLDAMDRTWTPTQCSWRLNERHYGALQGLSKSETVRDFGEQQVRIWRRSYATRPPALSRDDPRWQGRDERYARLDPCDVPLAESLEDVLARVLPLWDDSLVPAIRSGRQVLVAAHGNSIRALIKHLDAIADDDIMSLDVPNGVPLVYEFDENLKPLRRYDL